MARINIEDSIYRDLRFLKLYSKCGDMDKATGSLVRAWSLAQKWWLTKEQTIPIEIWREQEINDLIIEVGLAEIINNRVRMRGSKEQFAWLAQRVESGRIGGRVSAQRPRDELGRLMSKRAPSDRQAESKRDQASISSSFSSSISKKETTTTGSGSGFLKEVKKELQDLWLSVYKDGHWIDSEISKCQGYILSKNIQIKNLGQYINSWLHRAYESKKAEDKEKPKKLSAPKGMPQEILKEKHLPNDEQRENVRNLMKTFRGNKINEL